MTVQTPPAFIQASSHPAENVRRTVIGATLNTSGVIGVDDLKVTQNGTPNMSVNVAGGRIMIPGSEATYQGTYAAENRGTTNLAISASDPTNPRIDLVVAKVQDAAYSGATNAWSLAIVTGTAAASPTAPSAPANSVVLARVAVAAAATTIVTANITDYRTRASGLSGSTVCTSTTRPSSPYIGQEIYETDTAKKLIYAGATSGWNPPWNVSWGIMGIATVTANQTGIVGSVVDLTSASVTFTAVAGRRYRVFLETYVGSTVAADIANIQISDSSNNQLQSTQAYMPGSGALVKMVATLFTTLSAGSVTVKGRITRGTGTGTLSTFASSTAPTYLVVEDIGPSANPT